MLPADDWLAGPLGPAVAIGAMGIVTYLCRVSGVVLMNRVSLTPLVERALTALPGSIVAATVAPLALKAGLAGIVGVMAAVVGMRLVRNEVGALAAGLAIATAIRALGL